ncbi:MAG: endonuclease [Bacteroidetes bacterium MED-G13]|nr:endonuclease [Flavobacteriaceae bacterium]PDH46347.1 MAG: endonuclease [Bacteroidetes bacterium MED-G13]
MKNLSLSEKIIFFVNTFVAFIFLFSLLIPFIPPRIFSFPSVISLFTPILITLNSIFIFFWIYKLKKQFLLSLFVLVIGCSTVQNFINFSNNSVYATDNKISVLSYNVRLFNLYNWIDNSEIENQINKFLVEKNADIICLQEYRNNVLIMPNHPYKYEYLRGDNLKYGQVIYSKFPIINSGIINLVSRSNSAIYVDVEINKKTIRIYNVHLESFSLSNKKDVIKFHESGNKLYESVSKTFSIQQDQLEIIEKNIKKTPHDIIFSTDLNNTAFSYIYRQLNNQFKDSFIEKGNGFGTTFFYNYIPLRIDFILISESLKVNKFKTYEINYSDHKPIYSEIII